MKRRRRFVQRGAGRRGHGEHPGPSFAVPVEPAEGERSVALQRERHLGIVERHTGRYVRRDGHARASGDGGRPQGRAGHDAQDRLRLHAAGQQADVQRHVHNPQVVFTVRCVSGATPSQPTLTVPMSSATYTAPDSHGTRAAISTALWSTRERLPSPTSVPAARFGSTRAARSPRSSRSASQRSARPTAGRVAGRRSAARSTKNAIATYWQPAAATVQRWNSSW